jgi:hypothetical protein
LIDLRSFDITPIGSGWVLRCRHCQAGWLVGGDGSCNVDALIEHAMTHQRRSTRAELLRWQMDAVGDVLERVDRELADVTTLVLPARAESLVRERTLYAGWLDDRRRELEELAADPPTSAPARVQLPDGDAWLPNKSFITRTPWRI